jgi:WD40 repeat protein
MKALLMSLVLGAVAVVAVGQTAAEDNVSGAEQTPNTPTIEKGDLTQVASASILAPQRVVWSKDGSALYIEAAAGNLEAGVATAISRFDIASGSVTELTRLPANERVLDISSNGVVAVMRDFDKVVLIDPNTQGDNEPLIQGRSISSASFAPDGGSLAVVLDNGTVLQLWDVATAEMTGEYRSPDLPAQAFSVTFSPSGNSLTWYAPDGGQALDLASGVFGPFIPFESAIYDVRMCTDTGLLVALNDGSLTLWDTTNATPLQSQAGTPVFSSDCSPTGDQLLVTSQTDVGLLSLPSFSVEQSLAIAAQDASFSPDGSRIAVVGADGEISVWE